MGASMSITGLVKDTTVSFDVASVSLGSGANIQTVHGAGSQKPDVKEITVMKSNDRYSPALYQASLQGSNLQLTVSFGSLAYTFDNAVISSYQLYGKGTSSQEQLTFAFTNYSFKADSSQEASSEVGSVSAGWASGGTCSADDDDDDGW